MSQPFLMPPNRAKLLIKGPLTTQNAFAQGMFQAGLTAEDLEPVDWRPKISPVLSQEQCGNCWAMSSTAALVDRCMLWGVEEEGKMPILDPAIVAQCMNENFSDCLGDNNSSRQNMGCQGGWPRCAGLYFEDTGVPANCLPWGSVCAKGCTDLPKCADLQKNCSGKVYKARKGSTKNLAVISDNGSVDAQATILNIKKELRNGPVCASFFVPYDFMASGAVKPEFDDDGVLVSSLWKSTGNIFINGSYGDMLDNLAKTSVQGLQKLNPTWQNKKTWGDIIMEGGSPAGHAVEIVGWGNKKVNLNGVDENISYWIIKNSWGVSWMDKGYCFYAMNEGPNTKQHNKDLALDVPIKSVVIESTGNRQDIALFGSMVSFNPVGGKPPAPLSPNTVPENSEKLGRLIYAILFVSLAFFLDKYYRERVQSYEFYFFMAVFAFALFEIPLPGSNRPRKNSFHMFLLVLLLIVSGLGSYIETQRNNK